MITITATALRAHLDEFLDAVSRGERIVIERHHQPIAMLMPYEDTARLEPGEQQRIARSVAALGRLRARGKWLRREDLIPADAPDAVTAIRDDRSRDDA